jgi:hypothetical protein
VVATPTTNDDAVLAELKLLHEKVDRVLRARRPPVRHAWLAKFVKDLEYDPVVQYKVHLYAMYWWVINFVAVILVFALANHTWQVISVLYLVLVSLYANWATDYGAMSAALAAQQQAPLPEVPLETHVEPPQVDAVEG